jgi:hypothetical protein
VAGEVDAFAPRRLRSVHDGGDAPSLHHDRASGEGLRAGAVDQGAADQDEGRHGAGPPGGLRP